MPVRGLLSLLRGLGVLCIGALAVVGGLGLVPAGLIAVAVAGLLAACIAVSVNWDVPRRDRRSVLEPAVHAAAWTVAGLLALSGVVTVGGTAAAVLAALAGMAAVGTWLVVRARGTAAPWPTTGVDVLLLPVPPEAPSGPGGRTPELSALSTPELGREWLRTTAALGGRLSPHERQALVRRREETLDELERRDPAGFARWLAHGPALDTDPAGYVQGRSVRGDPAAGTDAA